MTDEKISREDGLELQVLSLRAQMHQKDYQAFVLLLQAKYKLTPLDSINLETLAITRVVQLSETPAAG
jgi:hypothetical protein